MSTFESSTSTRENPPETRGETALDAALRAAIEDARRPNGSLALELKRQLDADGRESLRFEIGRPVSTADTFEPPPSWRKHQFEDVASLAAYALRYGSKEDSVVLFNDANCTLVLNETPASGERECCTLPWRFSAEWNAWQKLLGSRPTHRDLFDFLIERQRTLRDPKVFEAFRRIRYDMNAKAESDVQLDGETMSIAFTAKKGDELVKLPRQLDVVVPVLESDALRPDLWVPLCMHIEACMPRSHNEQLTFKFFCPEFEMARRERINREVGALRASLPEWVIVRGNRGESQRRVGIHA